MRKKQEILEKKIKKFPSDELMSDEAIKRNVCKAMQEYADEQSVAFAEFLVKNYQPRFPNKGEWTKIFDRNDFKKIYTTTELLTIFINENK